MFNQAPNEADILGVTTHGPARIINFSGTTEFSANYYQTFPLLCTLKVTRFI